MSTEKVAILEEEGGQEDQQQQVQEESQPQENATGTDLPPSTDFHVETAQPAETPGQQQQSDILDDPAVLDDPKLNTLADIHRTFSTVINEFRGDKSAERFMEEYEKMYEALKKSHREMKALQFKCATLQSEIKYNTEKVQLAIHLSQEDRGMIATLNRQMNEAWAMVDVMSDREAKAKAAVSAMQGEIQVLTGLVEEGMGMDELQALSEKAAEERNVLEQEIANQKEGRELAETKLAETVHKLKEKEQQADQEVKNFKAQIDKLKQQNDEEKFKYEQLVQLCNRLTRQNGRLSNEKKKLESEIVGWKTKLRHAEEFLETKELELAKCGRLNRTQKEHSNELEQELKNLKDKIEKMNVKIMLQTDKIELLESEEKSKDLDMKAMTKDLKRNNILNKDLSAQNRKLASEVQNLKNCLSNCKDDFKIEMGNLKKMDKDLRHTQAILESTVMKNNILSQKTETLTRNYATLTNEHLELEATLRNNIQMNRELMQEINALNQSMRQISKTIEEMLSEKDRLLRKINQGLNKVMNLEEELITKENMMIISDKSRLETESVLRSTQESLVHALNQRDTLSNAKKQLELLNNDLMATKINMAKQLKTVSEDVTFKEHKIDQLIKEKDLLKEDLNALQCTLIEEQNLNKANKIKILGLQKDAIAMDDILNKCQQKIEEQEFAIEELTNQRNILGLQCVKKIEEVKMLLEKNRVLEDIMNMGNKLYEARLDDIKALNVVNADLYRQKHAIMKQLENLDTYRSKLGLANQQLVSFMARCKALEGESIMNVHNHRRLKARDYSKFEMVLKIQHLTKRLIFKSEHLARLECTLKEKSMILSQMKAKLEKGPGKEIVQQAVADRYQKERIKRKLKLALAEVNMVEWKYQEREDERDKLKKKLDNERKKRLEQSKKYQQEKEKLVLPPIVPGMARCEDPSGLLLDLTKATRGGRAIRL